MKSLFLIVLFLLTLGPSALADAPRLRPEGWATPVLSDSLENWYRVDERLYRSAQPDEKGMAELPQLGIARVLNLRQFHADNEEAAGTDLQLHRVPMNAGRITDADVVKALRIITSSAEPILVHCWHGSDRTGTIVALYRILVQGWTREAALDELMHGGYGYHGVYANIPAYIREVDLDQLRLQLKTP